MSMMSEFKDFAMKGNVIDMAVGIVIGGAFGKIVASFVSDILMPAIGALMGGVDFSDLAMKIKGVNGEEVAIKYGAFLQTTIDFLIIAFSIFMVIKAINKMKKKEEEKPAEPPKPSNEEVLLKEIRDALKQRQ